MFEVEILKSPVPAAKQAQCWLEREPNLAGARDFWAFWTSLCCEESLAGESCLGFIASLVAVCMLLSHLFFPPSKMGLQHTKDVEKSEWKIKHFSAVSCLLGFGYG